MSVCTPFARCAIFALHHLVVNNQWHEKPRIPERVWINPPKLRRGPTALRANDNEAVAVSPSAASI